MQRGILLFVFAGIVLFTINESYGYTEKFETLTKVLDRPPYICVLEPNHINDWRLTETHVKYILKETKGATDEWESLLKSQERSRDSMNKWEIGYEEVSLSQQDGFDYAKCGIIIMYEPEPHLEEYKLHATGLTEYREDEFGKFSLITIYYLDIKICETSRDEYYIYYGMCYGSDIILAVKMANTARHEIGHALGLGHYTADDPDVNDSWARDGSISPSIMTMYRPENTDQRKITQKDIEAVRKIYGVEGFVGLEHVQETKPPVQQKTEITQESKAQEKTEPKIPVWVKNNARWWSQGMIGDSEFVRGIQYLITQGVIKVSQSGQEAYPSQEIPPWIKNNAKWWAEGKITEEDFVRGIEYLVRNGILRV